MGGTFWEFRLCPALSFCITSAFPRCQHPFTHNSDRITSDVSFCLSPLMDEASCLLGHCVCSSYRGGARPLECWSPGLRLMIPPWCLPSDWRGRRAVCPLPGSQRPRAVAGLCAGGGSAAGAQTHVEINSHLGHRVTHLTCFMCHCTAKPE